MLRQAGGGSSGGGRPPVNIEVNFVPGSGPNALKQAREDAKALKADLDAIGSHRAWGGGPGGSSPGIPGGGGNRTPTAPGSMPTQVPSAARPSRFLDNRSEDQRARDHADYLEWHAASQARYEANRQRRLLEDTQRQAIQMNRDMAAFKGDWADGIRNSAASAKQAVVELNNALGKTQGIVLGGGHQHPGAPTGMGPTRVGHRGGGGIAPHLIANMIGRGIGVDGTLLYSGARLGLAAGGTSLASAGNAALGIATNPITLAVGGLAAIAASRTTQGQEVIGGWGNSIGSTIESYTRPDGFVDQFTHNFSGGLLGSRGLIPSTGLGSWAIAPWRDSARTARNLTAAEERRRWMRHQFRADDLQASAEFQSQLQMANLPTPVDGTIYGAQQANRRQIDVYTNALGMTATDDPQSAHQFQGQERVNMLGGLIEARQTEVQLAKQAHEETIGYWRTTLQGLNKELDMKTQAVALAEKEVNARTAGYAGQSPGELRALERAYEDATDGDGKFSPHSARLLNRDGGFGDLEELQKFNRANLEKYAPKIAERLQKPLQDSKEAQEATQKAVEDFSEQMSGVQERSAKAVKKIADEGSKALTALLDQWLETFLAMIDEKRAEYDSKGNEPSSVPGV